MIRIAIVNGWSDDNKGDAAIVEGMIRGLSQASDLCLRFDIVSMFSGASRPLEEHYRHTRRLGEEIELHPSLLPVDGRGQYLPSAWLRIAHLVRALLLLVAPRSLSGFLLPDEHQASLDALAAADLVVSKGGHVIFSDGSLKSYYGLFRNLYHLIVAQRLGRPTAVQGQSIGPVHGYFHRRLGRQVLSCLTRFTVREPISLEAASELLADSSPVRAELCWDSAFLVPKEPLRDEVAGQLPERFVALTVRQWKFPYNEGDALELYRRYLDSVAYCVQRLHGTRSLPVVVVPQAIGPTEMEDDRRAAEDLKRTGIDADLRFLEADLTAGQVATVYSQARMVVATRFHSAILAVANGVPAAVISYHGPKSRGIMSMLGLEDFLVEIGEVTGARLWSITRRVLDSREVLSDRLQSSVEDIREAILAESARLFDEALGKQREDPPTRQRDCG